ncbi:MAG: ORF6N domain-containing protein [Opitutae bacterium]|nr:ORF6N domain-containing protein [Opitutae bacterium]
MSAPDDNIRPHIHIVRQQRVILDSDLAALYGVSTKRFNEAFKRNRDRFPADFAFQLTAAEFAALRAQMVDEKTINVDGERHEPNWSQIATSSGKYRGATYRPWAFTEHGALMAANLLRSARARQMSLFVIRAFVRMREELATNAAILKRLAEIDRTLLVHDSALRDVYSKLLPLLAPPAEPPKRKIGFHPGNR